MDLPQADISLLPKSPSGNSMQAAMVTQDSSALLTPGLWYALSQFSSPHKVGKHLFRRVLRNPALKRANLKDSYHRNIKYVINKLCLF